MDLDDDITPETPLQLASAAGKVDIVRQPVTRDSGCNNEDFLTAAYLRTVNLTAAVCKERDGSGCNVRTQD